MNEVAKLTHPGSDIQGTLNKCYLFTFVSTIHRGFQFTLGSKDISSGDNRSTHVMPPTLAVGRTCESVSMKWMLVGEVLGGSDPHLGRALISLG